MASGNRARGRSEREKDTETSCEALTVKTLAGMQSRVAHALVTLPFGRNQGGDFFVHVDRFA